jgi:hypothetical protein
MRLNKGLRINEKQVKEGANAKMTAQRRVSLMSANKELEKQDDDTAKVIATVEKSGGFIEHVSCSSAPALTKHLLQCYRDCRRIFPGRPLSLPEKPAQQIAYFLTLDGADKIIEHSLADQVISVQAGMSMSSLRELLQQNKQWFPVCLPDEQISLMEYINRGSSGPLEHGFGEARDLVLGMQVVLGSGELVKCGGKVVKNVTGYDLPKLFCGAHGTLCIPFAAHLRLYALPETQSTTVFHFKDARGAFAAAARLRRSGLPLSCLEILDGQIFLLRQRKGQEETFAALAGDTTLLCVQVHGIAGAVAELETALSRGAGRGALRQEKLAASAEGELWKFLAGPPTAIASDDWLELSGPVRIIERLLSELKDKQKSGVLPEVSSLAWTARPGRNKAFLAADSSAGVGQAKVKLIEELSRAAKDLDCRITVASADDNYLWNVRNLPQEDLVLNELKHRLKQQYDPQGILNPLVCL